MMQMTDVNDIVEALEMLIKDDQVPNGVHTKLTSLLQKIKSAEEISLIVNKAISQLEELSEDVNIPSFIRTQIWGILSQLGALEAKI